VPQEEQELLTLHMYPSSASVFVFGGVAQSLVSYDLLCIQHNPLFVFLSFCF
jgi:hypothetical protein